VIREGKPSDLPEIIRIRTSVKENHLSIEQMAAVGITPLSLINDMRAGNIGCWVAESGEALAGFSMADRRDASIFALFIDPRHEGKGYGGALLAACEDWLRSQGHALASLGTGRETKAFGFYLRRGWEPTGEISGHFAGDAVLRRKL
jgi:GNAT superfamily N-acetyltransferase